LSSTHISAALFWLVQKYSPGPVRAFQWVYRRYKYRARAQENNPGTSAPVPAARVCRPGLYPAASAPYVQSPLPAAETNTAWSEWLYRSGWRLPGGCRRYGHRGLFPLQIDRCPAPYPGAENKRAASVAPTVHPAGFPWPPTNSAPAPGHRTDCGSPDPGCGRESG